MPSPRFIDALNAQIEHELAASQQYLAAAVFYDRQTLPRLAAFFYEQASEERTHAMIMVKYLLDVGVDPKIPGVDEPRTKFAGYVEPIKLALEQERAVGDQISQLVGIARDEKDYLSEQFVQWFLREQVEEVALMNSLVDVAERAGDQPLLMEDFLARENLRGGRPDSTAPPAAGQ
jgi:ferritin